MLAGAGIGATAWALACVREKRLAADALLTIGLALAIGLSSLRVEHRPLGVGAPFNAGLIVLMPLGLWLWSRISKRTRRLAVLATGGVLAVSSALAVFQHFVVIDYGELLASVRPTSRIAEPSRSGDGYHAGGLLFHRLKFAHTAVLLTLGCAGFWIKWSRRTVGIAAAALLLAALYGTGTRASWVALGVGLGAALCTSWCPRRWRLPSVILVAGGLLLIPALGAYWQTDWPTDRSIAWKTAWTLFISNPLLGLGYGGYPGAALDLHGGVNTSHPLLHFDAHSLLLQLIVEQGLLGGAVVAALGYRFWRALDSIGPATMAVLCAGLSLGIVHNLFFHPVVWGAWAMALAISATDR